MASAAPPLLSLAAPSFATGRLWAFPVLVALFAGLHSMTGIAAGPDVSVMAALAIMIIGVPHGALDVEIAAVRFSRASSADRRNIIAVYLCGAAAMAMLWWSAPPLALLLFLAVSILHFSQDWAEGSEPFLAITAGWAIITMPALAHTDAVTTIFSVLVGSDAGATITHLLACSAAPAALCSLILMLGAVQAGRANIAVELGACLMAAVLLPPLVAFALYFCVLHTPQHMAGAWRETAHLSTARRVWVVTIVSSLALGFGAVAFHISAIAQVGDNIIAASFITLSILTLPHFVLEAMMHRALSTCRQSGTCPIRPNPA